MSGDFSPRRGGTFHANTGVLNMNEVSKIGKTLNENQTLKQKQKDDARAKKLQAEEAGTVGNGLLSKFVRELKDPRRSPHMSKYTKETQEWVFAVLLKKEDDPDKALRSRVNVAQRLTKAKLNLCFLEPDEDIDPGVLCILVKAPQEVLLHEWKRLSVEHFIRAGVYKDMPKKAETIAAGAQIVLLDRILDKVLNIYGVGGQHKSTIPGWNPVSVSKQLIEGVETYFPLHDEHFNKQFLQKVDHDRPRSNGYLTAI
jgi:hypothetical protein